MESEMLMDEVVRLLRHMMQFPISLLRVVPFFSLVQRSRHRMLLRLRQSVAECTM